jgi:hypothetical protein
LFEDAPNNTGAAAFTGVVVSEVGFSANYPNSRRDLWIKFSRYSATKIQCQVFRTRNDTGTAIASVVGYVDIGANRQTLTLTRNGTQTPILTGLAITGVFSAEIVGTNVYWWGYTAAPDLVMCDNIVTLLKARIGANAALYGIATDNIYTGDETEAEAMPLIAVVAQPVEIDLSVNAGSTMVMTCPIEVHVAISTLTDPASAWRTCREYMASVESILHDENKRSYKECMMLYRQSSQGPGPANGKPTVMVGIVRVAAVFPFVWRDDVYPRS